MRTSVCVVSLDVPGLESMAFHLLWSREFCSSVKVCWCGGVWQLMLRSALREVGIQGCVATMQPWRRMHACVPQAL